MTSQKKKEHKNSRTFKITSALTVFLVFYLLTEYTVSVLHKPQHGIYATLDYESATFNYKILEDDPDLIQRPIPNLERTHPKTNKLMKTNSMGYRGVEFEMEKEEGVKRVVFLGDSLIFGMGLGEGETIPKLIEKELGSKAPDIEVINLAAPGYTSFHGKTQAKALFSQMKPDLVVFCYGFYDGYLVSKTDAQTHASIPESMGLFLALNKYLKWSPLFQLFRGKYRTTAEQFRYSAANEYNSGNNFVTRVTIDEFQSNIMAIISETRKHGGKCVAMDSNLVNYYCRDTLEALCKKEKIPLVLAREALEAAAPMGKFALRAPDKSKRIVAVQVKGFPDDVNPLDNKPILLRIPSQERSLPLAPEKRAHFFDLGDKKDLKAADGVFTARFAFSADTAIEFAPMTKIVFKQRLSCILFINSETFYRVPRDVVMKRPGVYYSPIIHYDKPAFAPLLSPVSKTLPNERGAKKIAAKTLPAIIKALGL